MVPKVKKDHDWQVRSYLTISLEERRNGIEIYTHDYFKLKETRWHPVFIFGNHQPGGIHWKFLEGMRYLGAGRTAVNNYLAKNYKNSIPIVYRQPNAINSSYLLGDVFLADANHILEIDRLMKNNIFHTRENAHVKLLEQNIVAAKKESLKPILKTFIWLTKSEVSKDISPKDLSSVVQCQSGNGDQRFAFQWQPVKIKESLDGTPFNF